VISLYSAMIIMEYMLQQKIYSNPFHSEAVWKVITALYEPVMKTDVSNLVHFSNRLKEYCIS